MTGEAFNPNPLEPAQEQEKTLLVPGFRLDRYELLTVLAKGGMGSVWLARLDGKHGFEKIVAVKTILPAFAFDERFRTMLLDEARLASKIIHPNVAQTLDLGDFSGVLYTVMEWVDGDSLYQLQRAASSVGFSASLGVVLRALVDSAAGLHAAHELRDQSGNLLGVVHRDVSPQNILVTTSGLTKVIDFGIAKARDRLMGETSPGEVKGTVRYMSPEQARGGAIDRRSDIWSLGCIFYFLMGGKPPYDGIPQIGVLGRLLERSPPDPLDDSVPKELRQVLSKALAPDPELRFSTMAEFGLAIEHAMKSIGVSCSHSDAAAFVSKHLAVNITARRGILEAGLKAATDRQSGIVPKAHIQQEVAFFDAPTAAVPTGTANAVSSSIQRSELTEKPTKTLLLSAGVSLAIVLGASAFFALRAPKPVQPASVPSGSIQTEAAVARSVPVASVQPPSSASSTPPASASAAVRAIAKDSKIARPSSAQDKDASKKPGTKERIDDGF